MSFSVSLSASTPRTAARLIAWIDGAGAFLLLPAERITLGGPGGSADLKLTADLQSEHAAIVRSGEGYIVEAAGPAIVSSAGAVSRRAGPSPRSSGRLVAGRTDLNNGDELLLFRDEGSAVRLRFSQPNPLSASAVLTVEGNHRSNPRTDAAVLLADSCLLSSARDAHIRVPHLESSLVLFRREGELFIKRTGTGGDPPQLVAANEVCECGGVRFRLEEIPAELKT